MAKKTPPAKRKKKTMAKKSAAAVPKAAVEAQKSELPVAAPDAPRYKSFRLQKRAKPRAQSQPAKPVDGVGKIALDMLQMLRKNWKLFAGIVLIYGLLNLVLVRGFSVGGGYDTVRQNLEHGGVHGLLSGSTLFLYLLGSSGTSSSSSVTAGSYQFIVMLVVSLALIWTFRQLAAGQAVKVRDGFYKGMTPLVPFVLVACIIFLQLIPMGIGVTLYATVVTNGVAAIAVEKLLWALVAIVLSLLSLYMLTSSVFALYMVTLPDMTPMRALRAGRDLVRGRRWLVLSRVLFLPIFLMVGTAIIIIPLLLLVPPVAVWIFFLLGVISIALVHGYMYTVYRALL